MTYVLAGSLFTLITLPNTNSKTKLVFWSSTGDAQTPVLHFCQVKLAALSHKILNTVQTTMTDDLIEDFPRQHSHLVARFADTPQLHIVERQEVDRHELWYTKSEY